MKVVVTGSSGYIGYAVARAFRHAGHEVWGILRSEKKASLLRETEIIPCIAELRQVDTYEKVLAECAVWVQCAFENSVDGIALDAFLLDTYLKKAELFKQPKTLIYTSGIRVYGKNREALVDENTPLKPLEMVQWRPEHEKKLLEHSNPLLKTVVLRPGNVYGESGGLLAQLFAQAEEQGQIFQVNDGSNYWPMVHVQDLARAFVLAAEKECNRQVFNIVDNTLVTQKEIIESIAKITHAQVIQLSLEEAVPHLGKLAEGLATGGRISNEQARQLLGWYPKYPGFVPEIERYFHAWKEFASRKTEIKI